MHVLRHPLAEGLPRKRLAHSLNLVGPVEEGLRASDSPAAQHFEPSVIGSLLAVTAQPRIGGRVAEAETVFLAACPECGQDLRFNRMLLQVCVTMGSASMAAFVLNWRPRAALARRSPGSECRLALRIQALVAASRDLLLFVNLYLSSFLSPVGPRLDSSRL